MKGKGLSDARQASVTKKNMVLQYIFCKKFIKSLKSISGEWLYATCYSSCLFGVLKIK